jgi:anti-anti-sigma regulatory factor
VFSFFRKGKGDHEPQTITPPKRVVPNGATVQRVETPITIALQPPAAPAALEEADWDDLLLDSSATAESHSAVEEAAVLYANERVAEAVTALQSFLKDNAGSRDLQPWLLLFDLYQSQGMKSAFDELSMDFVVRFERSAPVWEEVQQTAPAPAAAAKPAKSAGTVVLKGMLDAAAEEEIQRLLKLAEGEAPVRLDVSKAAGIDASRAQLLGQVLLMVRKSGKRIAFSGAKDFTAVVKGLTEGDGRQEASFWRLLFELYEFQNLESPFEDAAVDYAVTFEVSPPSWEPMAAPMELVDEGPAAEVAEEAAPESTDAFSLEGVLNSVTEHRLKELERYAAERREVLVDLSRLVRVDFMTVGTLITTLIALNQAGKRVTLSGQNEMIHALFEVMGVRDFATLVRRKAR